jgi:hypothetical protein
VVDYLATNPDWSVLVPTVLWSGLIVNALAAFLQVGGMQAVGPVRAQTFFASQPIWAASLNYRIARFVPCAAESIPSARRFAAGAAFGPTPQGQEPAAAFALDGMLQSMTPTVNSTKEMI